MQIRPSVTRAQRCKNFNCRCWAEVKKGPPVPPRKPNCNEQRKERDVAYEKLRELEEEKDNLVEELESLKIQKDEILQKIYKTSGSGIILHLIEIPLEKIGWIAEIIQRWIGYQTQNITLDNLDALVKEFMEIARAIMKKIEAIKALNLAIHKARENLLIAQNALEKCRERIPNG